MDDKQVTGWTGWIAFASIMMMFEGFLQVIYGLAAIFHQTWYITTSDSSYVLNVGSWGWVTLVLGVLIFISGALLLSGNLFGRSVALLLVVLGILANIALIPVAPVWSILALVVYALVGYAIIAHGSEMKEFARP